MTNKTTLFSYFQKRPYFTKKELKILTDKLEIPISTLNSYVYRAIKRKEIIPLKRDYYIPKDFFNLYRSNLSYRFFLANNFTVILLIL